MTDTTTGKPGVSKHFTSSILLWMRTDKPRQAGVDRWKGPHSGIIAATPGLLEYRQVHLAEHTPGRWPATPGIETAIPEDRRIDGTEHDSGRTDEGGTGDHDPPATEEVGEVSEEGKSNQESELVGREYRRHRHRRQLPLTRVERVKHARRA